ncbi:MAG: glycine--tRNA ligase [Candidatus Nanohaloarchaeota archaeon QJJ-7]|nr:glycine--tRNA ligase [Candidatus Nanohaloarchaeota archaeon QJJ-7]
MTSEDNFSEELEAHLTRNGFIWGPEPEIYDSLAGFYTYGPMGKLLKNKLEDKMSRVFKQEKFYEVEAPIIMPEEVWDASGHLETFVDPMVLCSECEGSYRADKLIEEDYDVVADGFSDEELLEFIDDQDITCPSCGGEFEQDIHDYNLMMETRVAGRESYSRPETATTTYLPFKRYWRFFRKKLPIKVFQIGKAFRNEISPRQHVLRGREFTQAEGQIFVTEEMKHDWDGYDRIRDEEVRLWSAEEQEKEGSPVTMSLEEAVDSGEVTSEGYAWSLYLAWELFRSVGIPEDRMRFREHQEDEKAHYAEDAWDLEVELDSFGWTECCGVHDRGDYDLSQHTEHSPEDLSFKDNHGKEVMPHILEIAFGTDRPTFALLDIFFDEEEERLQIPTHVAPVDVAVFPLVTKDGLPDIAEEVYRQLHERRFDVEYDDSGSIGKRYARQDAKGTALCVTVDYDTKEDDTVTLRERDTSDQVRLNIEDLDGAVQTYLYGDAELRELGEPVE